MKVSKRIWIALSGVLAVVCIFSLVVLNNELEARTAGLPATMKPVVIIDPGHGGMDGGASANNVLEKEINLKIAEKTRDLCELFGFSVVMTRESDISIHNPDKTTIRAQKVSDLNNRLTMMTGTPGAVVVSIHLNKFPQSYVHGPQVFYAPKTADSYALGEMMQLNLEQYLKSDKLRKIKKADSGLFLLYNNSVNPAVLVECGFISNPEEAGKLKSEEYQEKIAMTVCYTLMKFNGRGDEDIRGGNG